MILQRISARKLTELLGTWRGSGHSYLELSESIGMLVRDGRVIPGAVLPAERPLSEALGVSRTTVSASYQRLREDGIAVSRRGSGTVIRSPRRTADDLWSGGGEAGIDLSSACPEPWTGLAELNARALAEHPEAFRLTGYDTLGLPGLRLALAERYTRRGIPTAPDQIMVTLGAQHAIFLIARTLLSRGDRSLIESPSYPHAREALAATGALVAELPVGADGYDAAGMLEIAMRTSPRLAYLIPDHHNPTGMTMPPELKARLIATLTAQGSYVIADETTAELSLRQARSITPFVAFADHSHQQDAVITVGSLGKTVWGGLRIGWIRASADLIGRLETTRRIGDLGTGTWEQVVASLALEEYDGILSERTRQLTARHRVLTERVSSLLPSWSLSPAEGGVCVWADLGESASTRLSRQSARLGVRLVPGPRFGSPGTFERYVRLPFSAPEPELEEAIGRISDAWQLSGELGEAPVRAGAVI
ncbi:PLP-dependent aminotransferase family protein [Leucobacter rhizosphaerae]|uniref:PLP-dependent aminotransferase family protein n=1 Tax=Leucobacter rhizosphaerae TaxID=2932245 RepID=A0ABY4FVY6_9MICO|nr:PLP-dependent aminotransferase family protein [Leucobacter rhizosphaerae]UOQ60448.1 PLP-dependent aminotransferase family protein [Leucobacter rhizosphaerae]